jgi:hypothetical protein
MLLKPGFYETGKWTRLRKHEKPAPKSQIDQINKMMAQHGDQMQKIMDICLALAKTNAVVTETAALVKNNHPPNQNIKQKFNLNIFLNEQCKNAMNLIDFVKNIKLQMEDLLLHSKVGYADAISAIFNKEINKLDLTMRPLHCTDAKREIIYVKNADKWQHDEANVIAEKAIETLTNRNYMQIKLWKEENPEFKEIMDLATTYGQAFWENMMLANIDNKTFNSRVAEISLRGQYPDDYRERMDIKQDIKQEVKIDFNKEVAELIAALKV